MDISMSISLSIDVYVVRCITDAFQLQNTKKNKKEQNNQSLT